MKPETTASGKFGVGGKVLKRGNDIFKLDGISCLELCIHFSGGTGTWVATK
jgi:hypothetical protein